jgi:ankyrin repeat protein
MVALLRRYHEPLDIVDACALGDRVRVRDLLRTDASLANAQRVTDPEGRFTLTPLHWAVFCGRREILDDLLAAGADARTEADPSRENLRLRLALALCQGHVAIAKTLMAAGGEPLTEFDICLCYSQAAYSRQPAALDLLQAQGYDINSRRPDAEHCAVVHVRHPRFEPWSMLLDRGADLDLQRRNGKTMLHIAAARGLTTFVDELLDRGADTTILDETGKTAFAYAQGRRNQALYAHLVERGVTR